MSSEIFYDKAFIRVEEKYIPVINHGSSNCFDCRGRADKHWSVLNYPYPGQLLFTVDEMQKIADVYEGASMSNRGGTRKSRNRSFEEGEFRNWILSGMKSAHTVEDYGKCGNTVIVIDYSQERWRKYPISTTEALLDKIRELDGRHITVAFADERHVIHPQMQRSRIRQPFDFSSLPEYYVLQSKRGYFVKRSSKHIWFAQNLEATESKVRKFKTEKAARKYLEDNRDFLSKYVFEVKCVQNEVVMA